MLASIFPRPGAQLKTTVLRYFSHRNYKKYLFGGGLGKCQGGYREEAYFNQQELQMLSKIREHGVIVKTGACLGGWAKFEKVLDANITQTCSKNKYKNCCEEAYFLNEQMDCVKLLHGKLQKGSSQNLVSDNLKPDSDVYGTVNDVHFKKIPS